MGFRVVGTILTLDGFFLGDLSGLPPKWLAKIKKYVEWDLNGKKKPPADVLEVQTELRRRRQANCPDEHPWGH